MKKLLVVIAALLLGAGPSYAQKTKAQIGAEITTLLPDNTAGQITPLGLRTLTSDITNSIMPTAPVVSGNLACFNGTTGLLQDCGVAPSSTNGITALTGDITATGPGSVAATLATVNANTGSWGSATQAPQFTVNGKGLVTAAANVTVTPAVGSITGLGTGIGTWLATPSSANLLAALTTKTGTGNAVFGTAPTIDSLNATTAMTLAFLAGSTQCLQVNTSGVVSGTGAVCGGSGSSPGGSNTQVQYNNSGAFGGNAGLTYAAGGALSITPTTVTNNQGLLVTQTTPNTGSVAGPILLNTLTVTDQAQTVTGSTVDSYGQIAQQTNALRLNYRVSGGTGTHGALSIAANTTGSNGGTYGLASGTYQNVNATGTNWGLIGYANVGSSGVLAGANNMVALEAELLIGTGGSVANAAALNLNSQGPVAATSIYSAIVVDLLNNPIAPWNGAAAPFTSFAYFSNNFYGAGSQSIATTGSIFSSDAMTITNFANLGSVNVTGKIMNFPSLSIPGEIAGFTLPAPSVTGAFQFGKQVAAGTSIEAVAFTGPARFTGRRADTSSTAPSAVQSGEAIAGITMQGYDGSTYPEVGSIAAYAAQNFTVSNRGSYVAVTTTALNAATSTEVLRIQQGLMVGTTTDPGVGIVNTLTGFRIGNAAATGNVLRGNGTNFVSGQVGVADLSGLGAGVATALGIATGSAGAFIVNGGALVASSLTAPIHYGGSAAGSTLTLVSTSGVGTTDSMIFQTGASQTTRMTILTGGNIGIGKETVPQALLIASNNTATSIPQPTGTILSVNAADSASAAIGFQSWGTGVNPTLFMRGARGTAASPTASQLNDVLGFVAAQGYGASAYDASSPSGIYVGAGENHTATAQGTFIAFLTVPNTTTVRGEAMRIGPSGGLSVGLTTDPGIGKVSANNGYVSGGTAGVTCNAGISATTGRSVNGIITAC